MKYLLLFFLILSACDSEKTDDKSLYDIPHNDCVNRYMVSTSSDTREFCQDVAQVYYQREKDKFLKCRAEEKENLEQMLKTFNSLGRTTISTLNIQKPESRCYMNSKFVYERCLTYPIGYY